MSTTKYHCGLISPYTAATMSKSKKLMTKTNRSQAGILNMVSNISNVVGYSNVLPFLEYDAGNMTSASNSIVKRNKDTYSRKHCSITDGSIPADGNVLNEDKNKHSKINNNNNNNNNNNKYKNNDDNDDNGDINDEADAYVDAETDSLASMETLSDNVAIWVDGERHWISGIDANTTCTDLICALLNYQNGQQMFNHNIGNNHGQDNLNDYHDRNTSKSNNENPNPNPNPNNNCNIGSNNAINQSMPTSTKEGKQESIQTAVNQVVDRHDNQNISNTKATLLLERNVTCASDYSEYVIVKQHRHCEEYLDGNTKVFDVLPTKLGLVGVTNNEGEIGASNRKECELFLRRLVSPTAISIEGHAGMCSPQHAGNTQVASLLSTDKDSGMGSPVGSARSARFRRRKYKSATWFSQGNTLHPKATQRGNGISPATANAAATATATATATAVAIASAGNNVDIIANERLMRIILAQDETIHRQLSLLREKERQISKIEEEKHRVRERELGKNYLLETYFKGLDEAVACEPGEDVDEEIFVDEPCQHISENVVKPTTSGNSQHRSSRHNKELSTSHQQFRQQQRSNQLGNNTSSDAVKVNYSVAAADTSDNGTGSGTAGATAVAPADAFVGEVDNQKEIELQIFWLEKVYALNKQLQREEETLLKLHAKIRKHQVRCAYQMKNDVLEQIDELDAKLALQCADICRVEDNLVVSDEQLKGKLNLLEKLNTELQEIKEMNATEIYYEKDIQNCDLENKKINTVVDVEIGELVNKTKKCKPIVEHDKFVKPIITDICISKKQNNSIKQISYTNDERNELQNMTVKANDAVENNTTAVISPMTKLALSTSVMYSSMLNQHKHQHQHQHQHQQKQKQNLNELTQEQQKQQQQQQQQQQQEQLHNYPISHVNQFEQSSEIVTAINTNVNGIATQAQALTDKNMLPQHANNMKIIKTPMYEALSLNQMSSTTSNAVTCKQQLPDSKSTTHIISTTVPLEDTGYSIDLSRLGTLVT